MNRGLDPYGDDFLADPHPALAELRAHAPVAWIECIDAYFVSNHDLVLEVVGDPDTYSNRRTADSMGDRRDAALVERLRSIRSAGWPHVPTIADGDPPLHDGFRSIVAPYFTPTRLRELTPAVSTICDDLIDRWAVDGGSDFVAAFAEPFPLRVIAAVLDIGFDDVDELLATFARWRDSAVAAVGAHVDDGRLERAEGDIVEMQHFLADRLDRASPDDDDLFGALRRGTVPDPEGRARPLERAESLTILRQIFVGGIETTTKALSETMIHLAERPDVYALLSDDSAMRRRVVEESLRLSSPAQGILRTVTRRTELGGRQLEPDDRLFVMFAAANRDECAFADASTFEPTRPGAGHHLAFGRGIHVCLGAALTRLEMQVALERLSARVEYTLDADRPPAYGPSFILRGPGQLHMTTTIDGGESR